MRRAQQGPVDESEPGVPQCGWLLTYMCITVFNIYAVGAVASLFTASQLGQMAEGGGPAAMIAGAGGIVIAVLLIFCLARSAGCIGILRCQRWGLITYSITTALELAGIIFVVIAAASQPMGTRLLFSSGSMGFWTGIIIQLGISALILVPGFMKWQSFD
jgi:hypothetical protein